MKTSPRPWKFGYTDNLEYPVIIGADDEIVCVMHEEVSFKDGNLLATAPELLEALQNIIDSIDKGHAAILCPLAAAARAAIAKATGGEA
jgi:hypothetical protein